VAGIEAGAATLVLVGPTVALRPLLTDWQQIEPMTVETGGAERRLRVQG
jgi:hypothetical protein